MPAFRCLVLCLLLVTAASGAGATDLTLAQVQRVFPAARALTPLQGEAPAYRVLGAGGALGYALSTAAVAPIAAYSGRPVDVLVGLDESGSIVGASILHHEEPILVIGVADADLDRFIAQFAGRHSMDRIRVGARGREGYVGIDGIAGATITSMVVTSSISKAVQAVAAAHGIPGRTAAAETGPAATPAGAPEEFPPWRQLWEERSLELGVVALALVVLTGVLFFQDQLVEHTVFFHRLRLGYLVFTVFFIGFYCSAQLSVVNLLTFLHSFTSGFTWDTLLIEPVIFVLWGFVAVSILLWGRGVYCGWLCPFGAAQDLISKLANRLGFEGYRLPQMVHERLWAIKYLLLIALFGLSLDSMTNAARLAEVEPFKTTFVLRFAREPQFVAYALALLAVSAVNSKFYCKYLCPLGAGLSLLTTFRIFDWLRRRRECGRPCQACAHQCQIAAIKPTGEIIDHECHYCLECQVTYWDDQRCPPLVEKRQHREQKVAGDVIATDT